MKSQTYDPHPYFGEKKKAKERTLKMQNDMQSKGTEQQKRTKYDGLKQ